MRYLCIVVAILAFVVTPAMAQPDIGVFCFEDDFEAYNHWTRLRQCSPVWGYGKGPENRIVKPSINGTAAVRLKGNSGNRQTSYATNITNFAGCMGGKLQIFTFTLQSDLDNQNNVGNHFTVQLNESGGGELARFYGWSSTIAGRVGGFVTPPVDITDGAVHNFAIVYDPASGLCEWYHNGGVLGSKTLATGYAAERVYVQDVARGANDYIFLDNVVCGTPPIVLPLDILPEDDPNLFTVNMQSKGRLPMSILESDDAAGRDIDVNSISIAGLVFPVKEPKGENDLIIHVSRRDLIAALGLDAMAPGTEVDVTVDGALLNGMLFTATDSITLVARCD